MVDDMTPRGKTTIKDYWPWVRAILLPIGAMLGIVLLSVLTMKFLIAQIPYSYWQAGLGLKLPYILLFWNLVLTFALFLVMVKGKPLLTYVMTSVFGGVYLFWMDPGRRWYAIRGHIKPETGTLETGNSGNYSIRADHVYSLGGVPIAFALNFLDHTITPMAAALSEAFAKRGQPDGSGEVTKTEGITIEKKMTFSWDYLKKILKELHDPSSRTLDVNYKVAELEAYRSKPWSQNPMVWMMFGLLGIFVVAIAYKILASAGAFGAPLCIVGSAAQTAAAVAKSPPLLG